MASGRSSAGDGMEREANYAAIGAFVLLVLTMTGLFVYWYNYSHERRDYVRYEIYFDGSVTGLADGGAVRYLGVNIGRVVRLRIDGRAANRVQVVVDIESTAPVSDQTLAQLSLQGITGLLYIDLQQQKPNDPTQRLGPVVPSMNYPVIRSVHSDFDVFITELPDLEVRVAELVSRINRALADENIAAVSRLINNLDRASTTLPATTRDLAQLISELRTSAAEGREAIGQFNAAVSSARPDLSAALQQLRATSDRLASASEQLNGLLTENRAALHGFMSEGLPQVEALAREGREAARQFELLTQSLRDNPGQLLNPPADRGVEVPR